MDNDSDNETRAESADISKEPSAAANSRALFERLTTGAHERGAEQPGPRIGDDADASPPTSSFQPTPVRPTAPSVPAAPSEEDRRGAMAGVGEKADPLPRKRRRLILVLSAIGAALLLAALSAAAYLAISNKSRADRWQARSVLLERNVAELNGLLVDRSNQLNARTTELNRMATTVRRQQSALNGSEADVASLQRRQTALANEKAQVEDSRAQLVVQASSLQTVANAFVACKSGLVDLLGYVLNQDYASASAVIDSVSSDCQYAEATLSDYSAKYP